MIAFARYTSAGTTVAITMQDGTEWHTDAALPPDTEIRRTLAEWVAEGGVIAPFVPVPAPVRVLTPREFMDRLPMQRQAEITAAATQAPAVLLWLLRLSGARDVDVAHPETVAGVTALRDAGLLTEQEAAALLVAA